MLQTMPSYTYYAPNYAILYLLCSKLCHLIPIMLQTMPSYTYYAPNYAILYLLCSKLCHLIPIMLQTMPSYTYYAPNYAILYLLCSKLCHLIPIMLQTMPSYTYYAPNYAILYLLCSKLCHLIPIMLQTMPSYTYYAPNYAILYLLCSKLCWRNFLKPIEQLFNIEYSSARVAILPSDLATCMYTCTHVDRWGRLRNTMMPWPGLVEPLTECLGLGLAGALAAKQLLGVSVLLPLLVHTLFWLGCDMVLIRIIQVCVHETFITFDVSIASFPTPFLMRSDTVSAKRWWEQGYNTGYTVTCL